MTTRPSLQGTVTTLLFGLGLSLIGVNYAHEIRGGRSAIRTVVLHDGVALLQAGAGITADSDPTAEHEECLRKLAALERALDLAEGM